MAPRKPNTTTTDPSDLISSYLKRQNRPYSATDISSNLHNQVTKTRTDKLCKEMFERGEIGGRVAGKQWVFWWLQDSKDNATPEELAALSSSIAALRENIPALKASLKAKMAAMATLCSAPTTQGLRESVEKLGDQRDAIEMRLKVLRAGGVKKLERGERERAEAEYRSWKGKEMRRRRIWKEAEGMMLDGMTRAELYEKLGIDEDA